MGVKIKKAGRGEEHDGCRDDRAEDRDGGRVGEAAFPGFDKEGLQGKTQWVAVCGGLCHPPAVWVAVCWGFWDYFVFRQFGSATVLLPVRCGAAK